MAEASKDMPDGAVAQGPARELQRRRHIAHLRMPERRTGFDRRAVYPLTQTLRSEPLGLLGVLVLVNGLSVVDFGLTLTHLESGVGAEANPLLAALFEQGPVQAFAFKLTVTLLVTAAIWRLRRYRAVLSLALAALGLYLTLIGYHLLGPILAR